MPSPFDPPSPHRLGMFSAPLPPPAPERGAGASPYPDLPAELRNSVASYANTNSFVTPERQRAAPPPPPPPPPPVPAPPSAAPAAPAASASDNLSAVARASKTILEALEAEKRYPPLDDIVSRMLCAPEDLFYLLGVVLTCTNQRASRRSTRSPRHMPGSLSCAQTTTPFPMPYSSSTIARPATP